MSFVKKFAEQEKKGQMSLVPFIKNVEQAFNALDSKVSELHDLARKQEGETNAELISIIKRFFTEFNNYQAKAVGDLKELLKWSF